jgi:hypothetical protein
MKTTSDGPVREWNRVPVQLSEKAVVKKGKWTTEELKIITDTLKKYVSLSLKSIRAHLNSNGIDISETVLGKMRRELC